MQSISYTSLRQNLSSIMDTIADNRETVHITRKGHDSMVMMSEADFSALQETLYLLSSSNNAARLSESFKQAEDGDFIDVNWDDIDED